jgi:hypothetical protein
MTSLEKRAKQAVAGLGRRGRTTRIPEDVREKVLAYAEEQRRHGVTWQEIAKVVGLSATVLTRWRSGRRPATGKVVPVSVRDDGTGDAVTDIAVVTPAGYRLEGISLAEAVDVLRALR